MKTKYYFLFLFTFSSVCISVIVNGQARITGTIFNAENKPLSKATVLLLNTTDSSLIKGSNSNDAGLFSFDKPSTGNYLVMISSIGYEDKYIMSNGNDAIGTIVLQKQSTQMQGVTVTSKKPMFEQKVDRMVINVKNSITSAGTTVLDVLEKSPGVMVNRNSGAISMSGKDGVMVMINGKMTYMPQDALVQMLNGINSSNVEKIELITTPPSKYDASGNAGYINIVLINNPNEGFNGSYTASMGVGNGTIPSANMNFNYRKKAINLYGSYSFIRTAQLQMFDNYRKVYDQGTTKESYVRSDRDPFQRDHNARIGIDYKLGKKTVLGALIAGYDNKWSMDAFNRSSSNINDIPDTTVTLDNNEINHWKNLMGNINLQHTIKEGDELTFNTDYLYYHNKNPTKYLNTYYNGNNNFLFKENTTSGKKTIIKIWVSQIDYSKKINEKTNLQTGLKLASARFTNDVLVEKKVGNVWVPDPDYTANYYLKETIAAAYISFDRKLNPKTDLKAGLRYEYSTSQLGTETIKNILDKKYGKLFPTFYISHKLNDNHSFNFSYSRRITRPAYTQLAPFIIFLDPKTFISGNTALQPAISDAIKVDYMFKKIIFSASYTYESKTISRFQSEVNTSTNVQTTTPQNMNNSQLFYVSASLPVKITQWWSSQLNMAVNWNKLSYNYKNEKQEASNFYYTFSGSQSFTLPKKFSAELSGFFQSRSFIFGGSKIKAFGEINAAVQKKFNNSSLSVGVDNIFNSMDFRLTYAIPEQHFESNSAFIFLHRVYKLTWTQNFGNKALKDKRNRITASEEERGRVQ